jgi:hypothetical protein
MGLRYTYGGRTAPEVRLLPAIQCSDIRPLSVFFVSPCAHYNEGFLVFDVSIRALIRFFLRATIEFNAESVDCRLHSLCAWSLCSAQNPFEFTR